MAKVRLYYSTYIDVEVDESKYNDKDDLLDDMGDNAFVLFDEHRDEAYENCEPNYNDFEIIQ